MQILKILTNIIFEKNSNEIILFFFCESINLKNHIGQLMTHFRVFLPTFSCQKPY